MLNSFLPEKNVMQPSNSFPRNLDDTLPRVDLNTSFVPIFKIGAIQGKLDWHSDVSHTQENYSDR